MGMDEQGVDKPGRDTAESFLASFHTLPAFAKEK